VFALVNFQHVDARLYANAADNEPFTEVDDAEQAALASLVLELWQRPDRDGEMHDSFVYFSS
jgi:hypothetical protein